MELVFISFILGIAASFIAWLIVSKALVPRINFSEKIVCSKSLAYENTTMYKIEIVNTSKRDAFEVSIDGRLILYGLDKKEPNKAFYYIARVGNGRHPYIPGKKKHNIRRFLVKPTKECREQAKKLYGLNDERPNLKRILEMDERNKLEITVICSHGYSGARKARTQSYNANSFEFKDDINDESIDIVNNL